MTTYHTPVLCDDAVRLLITDPRGTYVDGTIGGGGHAERICSRLELGGQLIGFDADEDAIRVARRRLATFGNSVHLVHSNFSALKKYLQKQRVPTIHGMLLDLGVSSYQLDEVTKGFSFRGDERIDMRMDRRQLLSGWEVVNTYAESVLSDLLWKYGEERNARRIAKKIVASRPIDTTGALRHVIEATVGKQFLTKTLARVFQAIRIVVNDELRSLEKVLNDVIDILVPGGRVVVISYHSLEDRIVKEFFRQNARERVPSGHKYIEDTVVNPSLRILTKKPLVAREEEIAQNPRARSAKLRAAERIHSYPV
ncbi:MAG: rRNA ((1402)-N(4))-methyltransferase [Bacteroidetes bacterium]|nr:rRNA ((1402)-N(4))-methyltransferase [Bacteroidota bacterium]